jgi:hypothetical protein
MKKGKPLQDLNNMVLMLSLADGHGLPTQKRLAVYRLWALTITEPKTRAYVARLSKQAIEDLVGAMEGLPMDDAIGVVHRQVDAAS